MLFKSKDRQITLTRPRRGVLSLAVLPREMMMDLDNNVASGSALLCTLTRYENSSGIMKPWMQFHNSHCS